MKNFLPITWRTRKTFLQTLTSTLGTLLTSWLTFLLVCFLLIRYTTITTNRIVLIGIIVSVTVLLLGQIKRLFPFTYAVVVFNSLSVYFERNKPKIEYIANQIRDRYKYLEEIERIILIRIKLLMPINYAHTTYISSVNSYTSLKHPKKFKRKLAQNLIKIREYKFELEGHLKELAQIQNELDTREALVTNIDSFLADPSQALKILNVPDISIRIEKEVHLIQKELDQYQVFA